ncbi:hypothetical protein RhiirA1_472293 [Rhizophagus irregularis]|uniref:Uncharacterized protein n=1 Tax=Rhizophagus irregularis TaxID=588596 RepID=A0A2I1F8Y7_9GLOM|nr:hypothetical protein RhiirA1_472293 [Rhizophagus irregularis]PKY30839.1 hypothetical protein RhiirB3_448136 [Rhizophagus irregularis]
MTSDQESINSSSSSSSSSDNTKNSYNTIKASIKEVYLWMDSELIDIFKIDDKLTWVEQKEDIITKLLPPLYKLVNKKYSVTNSDLLKMLYGRWRSRHRVNNIGMQGKERVEQNKRRAKKNSKMQEKKKRRTRAVNYLLQGKDKYIQRYPEKDLVQILKDSAYHLEEWKETDSDADIEDNGSSEPTIQTKSTSIVIYERWWHSPAPNLKRKSIQVDKNPASVPPIGTPSWCLNEDALKKFNCQTDNIPIYDYDTEDHDNSSNDSENNTTGDDESRESRENRKRKTNDNEDRDNRKRKRSSRKKSSKQKRRKKSKRSK